MCVLYLPLRLFFDKHTTLTLFVIIQALLAAIASYVLAKSAYKIIKSEFSFYAVFSIYASSLYVANYNHRLYSESLALSAIIFAFYFFIETMESKKTVHVFLMSLFIIWAVFLRPFLAPLIILVGLLFLYKSISRAMKIKSLLVFGMPILLIFGSWTYRNYLNSSAFIPLQSGSNWYDSDEVTKSRTDFIRAFGLGWIWWNENSEHTWFMNDETIKKFNTRRPSDSIFTHRYFSKNMFSNGLTIDSLKKAREYYWNSENNNFSETQRGQFAHKSASLLNKFIKLQKEKYPLNYYIVYPSNVFWKLLYQVHNASITSIKYPLNVIFMFTDAITNYSVFLFGFISILLMLFFNRVRLFEMSIIIIPMFLLSYFSFVLRIDESRFVTMNFPFLLIASVYGISILNRVKISKYLFLSIISILIYGGINSVLTDIKW